MTARPWVVSEGLGASDGAVAVSSSGLSLAEGLASGLSPAPALGVAAGGGCCAAGSPGPRVRTGRKYSWAVVPTCSRACSEFVPLGMLTMMLSVPWVWTSASCTPRPLTRRSMMPTAVFMLVSLTAFA